MLQKVALVTQNQNLSSITISPRVTQQPQQQNTVQQNANINANPKSSTNNDGVITSTNIHFKDDEDWLNDDEESMENGVDQTNNRYKNHSELFRASPPKRAIFNGQRLNCQQCHNKNKIFLLQTKAIR